MLKKGGIFVYFQFGSESPLNGHDTPKHPSSTKPDEDDIFQLGVILLEVITGRQINSQSEIHELKLEVHSLLACHIYVYIYNILPPSVLIYL